MKLNCILLGAPGAGKGTQAEILARLWNIPHISTGVMLRDAVRAGTALGRHVEPVLAAGGLVADDLMLEVVTERLNRPDARRGFVLDGFPRTIPQAGALDGLMAGRGPLIVIDIVVPDEILLQRLAGRGRDDDGPEVARARLAMYHRETEPLLHYYSPRSAFHTIEGDRAPDHVTAAILTAIDRSRPAAIHRRGGLRRPVAFGLPVRG